MGHLRQLFYRSTNLSILDALSFDYCRKRKFILKDDCQKYQYLVNSTWGHFLFAFQIKLPNIINGTLSSIGLFIGPNAMLVAGMLIAAIPLRSIVSSKRIYLVTLLRLLLIPIALLVLIKLIGFVHWAEKGEIIVLISFLATTSPSASTVTQNGGDFITIIHRKPAPSMV